MGVRLLAVMEPNVLHEEVKTSDAVVAQSTRVTLAAAVKLAMCAVLRSLGRDVGAPVTTPQSPRHTPPTTIRRTGSRDRFTAEIAEMAAVRGVARTRNSLPVTLRPSSDLRRHSPVDIRSDKRTAWFPVQGQMLRQQALVADPERTPRTAVGRRGTSAVELTMIDDVVLRSSDVRTDRAPQLHRVSLRRRCTVPGLLVLGTVPGSGVAVWYGLGGVHVDAYMLM